MFDTYKYNKAFKSDSLRLAVSLRSSIAKRASHLNAALVCKGQKGVYDLKALFYVLAIHLLFPKDSSSKLASRVARFSVNWRSCYSILPC